MFGTISSMKYGLLIVIDSLERYDRVWIPLFCLAIIQNAFFLVACIHLATSVAPSSKLKFGHSSHASVELFNPFMRPQLDWVDCADFDHSRSLCFLC